MIFSLWLHHLPPRETLKPGYKLAAEKDSIKNSCYTKEDIFDHTWMFNHSRQSQQEINETIRYTHKHVWERKLKAQLLIHIITYVWQANTHAHAVLLIFALRPCSVTVCSSQLGMWLLVRMPVGWKWGHRRLSVMGSPLEWSVISRIFVVFGIWGCTFVDSFVCILVTLCFPDSLFVGGFVFVSCRQCPSC